MKKLLLLISLLYTAPLIGQIEFKHHELRTNVIHNTNFIDNIDFDQDGKTDIVSYQSEYGAPAISVCFNDNYYFKDCIEIPSTWNGQEIIQILHINNDSTIDYIAKDGIYISQDNGYEYFPASNELLKFRFKSFDLDSDGNNDLIPYAYDESNMSIPVILNKDSGLVIPEISENLKKAKIQVFDIDTDGDHDILTNENIVFLQNQEQFEISEALSEEIKNHKPVYLNNDDLIDFINIHFDSNLITQIKTKINNGSGTFSESTQTFPEIQTSAGSDQIIYNTNTHILYIDGYNKLAHKLSWSEGQLQLDNTENASAHINPSERHLLLDNHYITLNHELLSFDLDNITDPQYKYSQPFFYTPNWKTIGDETILHSLNKASFKHRIRQEGSTYKLTTEQNPSLTIDAYTSNFLSEEGYQQLSIEKNADSNEYKLVAIKNDETRTLASAKNNLSIHSQQLDNDPLDEIILIKDGTISILDYNNGAVNERIIAEEVAPIAEVFNIGSEDSQLFILRSISSSGNLILDLENEIISDASAINTYGPMDMDYVNNNNSQDLAILTANNIIIAKNENGMILLEEQETTHNHQAFCTCDLFQSGDDALIFADNNSEKIYIYELMDGSYQLVQEVELPRFKTTYIECMDIDIDNDQDLIIMSEYGLDIMENATISNNTNTLQTSDINIFPNPTNGSTIYLEDKNKTYSSYSIINQKGSLIKKGTIPNNSIDIEGISTGLYKLILTGKSGNQTHTIYIQK